MKEIEYWIDCNKKSMQEKQEEYDRLLKEEHLPYDDMRLCNLRVWIASYKSYIQGLKDAKKYIENEEIEVL